MTATYISKDFKEKQLHYAEMVQERIKGQARSYYVETYGCQMNVRDSQTMAGFFEKMGFIPADSKEKANLIFFNTCCVRDHAEKKLMANIGSLKERKDADPSLIIGVCGCMMQQPNASKKLMNRFKFVDTAIGTNSLWKLPEIMNSIFNGERVIETDEFQYAICEGMPFAQGRSASAFVNIAFGCDNFCSYCIVPYVRGRERSRKPEDIIQEVKEKIKAGATEITLLGQNVNSYGKGMEMDFPDLLREINKVDGLERLRFMTSHPKDISEKLMHTIAECDKVCHHLHLPVQSGSDRILLEMNRHYDSKQYMEKVELLRSIVPDIELTTDIIVGFPGETEEDFDKTLELVRNVGYSAAFTFKYSPRNGTRAATMENQIPDAVKRDRLKRLNELQAEMTKASNLKYKDTEGVVLVEGSETKCPNLLHGRLGNFKSVYFDGEPSMIGTYQKVRIVSCNNNSLMGTLVQA